MIFLKFYGFHQNCCPYTGLTFQHSKESTKVFTLPHIFHAESCGNCGIPRIPYGILINFGEVPHGVRVFLTFFARNCGLRVSESEQIQFTRNCTELYTATAKQCINNVQKREIIYHLMHIFSGLQSHITITHHCHHHISQSHL
jgi:hypothetical protein